MEGKSASQQRPLSAISCSKALLGLGLISSGLPAIQGQIFRIYKELRKVNTKRTNNPIDKQANEQTGLKRNTNGQ
jgi:hypothetical protein